MLLNSTSIIINNGTRATLAAGPTLCDLPPTVSTVKNSDNILLRDGHTGPHGVGKTNSDGELLLSLCAEYQLCIKKPFPTTNGSENYIITRKLDRSDVLSNMVYDGYARCRLDDGLTATGQDRTMHSQPYPNFF